MSKDTPAQWRMVPVEPTVDMQIAGAGAIYAESGDEIDATVGEVAAAWRAMLAAAPQPTQSSDLRAAAQAVLDRWESPKWQWTHHGPTADLMADLRNALAAVRVGRLVPKRSLPADVARCSGVEDDEGGWREGCEDCMRRTDRNYFPQAAWMAPPALVVFECAARIEP